MNRYPSDSRVIVEPLARQPDTDGVLVGRKDTAVFLLLPADAVEVLDDLAAGCTVAEAQQRHFTRHGEVADIEDLLVTLEEHGFVRPVGAARREAEKGFHFAWISERWAQRLTSIPVLAAGALIVGAAILALILEPSTLPGWRAAYFPKNTAAGLLALMVFGLFTTFIHEMAHLTAARARGVSCRFGIGNQLWFLVWETDMTGIWALPRRQRYLPILAGPLIDLVTAAALIVVSYANVRGWLALDPAAVQFGSALLFIYVLRIVWQCYFFLRTDFYYALTNLLGCRNLMGDTVVLLKNITARLRRKPLADQSHIPAGERRMLRAYAVIWLAGRGIAFSMLLFIQLPLLFHYLQLLVASVREGSWRTAPSGVSLITAIFFTIFLLGGLGLWLKRLWWPGKDTGV
jgi:putative peptide zinc metalloprotease protein